MKNLTFLTILTLLIAMTNSHLIAQTDSASPLNVSMKTIDGEEVNLADKYKGKVVLIVNTASKCGLTPQYKQLQELHEKYASKGLTILGFPCNQFLGQEPGSENEIKQFCQQNYGVDFDMFSKIDVKGEKQSPLYKALPTGSGADRIRQNQLEF